MGLSVIIITKNEAQDLPRALNSVSFADEVIVMDSGSTDGTQQIAKDWGAQLYETDEWPGFGPQKNRVLEKASQDWVLSLDADEWIEPDLALEIQDLITAHSNPQHTSNSATAFRIRRRSIFIDRVIRFGDWRGDRVIRLFRRDSARFSDDLVHERLIVNGLIRDLTGSMGHFSVRSIEDSRSKMWQYNRSAAVRIAREGRGGMIKGFLKAIFSLCRALVLRVGLLDGLRGLQLAWFNARGTYLRYALAQSIQDQNAYRARTQSGWQRHRDFLHLLFVDHGFLRALYGNRFRLAGGLYRINQPSPSRLALYQRKYGIKTVINLRGQNEQLGWYRLEEQACEELGLKLVNTQVYSRGLVDLGRLLELKGIIQNLELPAVVHCKSGADRAGFFSVLYRHFRLGEPIETSLSELGLLYGHSKSAKTGVLDFFFETYLRDRGLRQAFSDWAKSRFNREALQSEFQPKSLATWFVDSLLRRE
jgi:glycosyltransferase involved in cell wall biosynthesis